MMANKPPQVRSSALRLGLQELTVELLDTSPLLPHEGADLYAELGARLQVDFEPRNYVEYLALRDIQDLTWELIRYQRLRAEFIASQEHEGLRYILSQHNVPAAEFTANGWGQGEECAIERGLGEIKDLGLTRDAVLACGMLRRLSEIERLDRILRRLEVRRDRAIRLFEELREAA